MDNNQANSPSSNLHKERLEGNKRVAERKAAYQYLKDHVATGSMVCDALGIPHKNFTWFKWDYEKANRLWEVVQKRCQKTGRKAWYLTTDPEKAPHATDQLSLFERSETTPV